jgi:hypothetical protein
MIAWTTLARVVWDSLQAPDPKSPIERIKRAHATYEDVGEACELANEIMKLTEDEDDCTR